MAWICAEIMFLDNLVVCREKRSEWELLDLRFPLGATDNLVEETDI
jgi:hypothetical protein